MRVFIYEFVVGGGCAEKPQGPLLTAGLAMVAALVDDFRRIPGVHVETIVDLRLAATVTPLTSLANVTLHWIDSTQNHWSTIDRLCQECDAGLFVAPELSGFLEKVTRVATNRPIALLGPSAQTVALFSDKHRSADWLSNRGISVPSGRLLTSASDVSVDQTFPAIIKPIDGAGSLGVRVVNGIRDLHQLDWSDRKTRRLETFCSGQPASVAILSDGTSRRLFPPCRQFFSQGSFEYRGGCVLADGPLSDRATRLAYQVARALPDDRGYIGVDIVLGDNPDGSGDQVIEVNPRMTTSYVGLRASTDTNLAHLILDPTRDIDLRFPRRPLEFRSDGRLSDSNSKVKSLCDG